MSTFKLASGDLEFKCRQQKVFDQLLVLENNRKNTSTHESERKEPGSNTSRRAQKSETRHFRGKESIFKKPQNPAPKNYINKIPDFKKNPHKWTKYSLEDVEDVTEESNTKSAMDFLRELANRRKMENGIKEEKLEELPDKIVFNKHVRASFKGRTQVIKEDNNQNDDDSVEKPSFSSSKLVMPEYVIGQKVAKKNRHSKKNKPEKGRELQLDHLMFEDD